MESLPLSTAAFIQAQLDKPLPLFLTLGGITLLLLLIRWADHRGTPFLFRVLVLLAVIPSFLHWAAGLGGLTYPLASVALATGCLVGAELYTLLEHVATYLSNGLFLVEEWHHKRKVPPAPAPTPKAA